MGTHVARYSSLLDLTEMKCTCSAKNRQSVAVPCETNFSLLREVRYVEVTVRGSGMAATTVTVFWLRVSFASSWQCE